MAEVKLEDIATKRNDDKGHGSTAETIPAATRKLQIFCVVLLILIVISDVTIGVLIHTLVSRNLLIMTHLTKILCNDFSGFIHSKMLLSLSSIIMLTRPCDSEPCALQC